MLSKKELIRYQRQLGLPSWGEDTQNRIKKSKIFIAGAGGLGSPVILYLAAAGVGNLTICDNDKVEITNLNRQILHSTETINKYKTDSALTTINRLNPEINITLRRDTINAHNAKNLISGHDIIIDCLDNFKTRLELNKISVKENIPMVHGGVSGFKGQITFISTPETACLSCFMPAIENESEVFVAGAAAGVIGSMQAVEALKYLSGSGENLKNKLLFWDGLSMKFETINLSKNPHCSICQNNKQSK